MTTRGLIQLTIAIVIVGCVVHLNIDKVLDQVGDIRLKNAHYPVATPKSPRNCLVESISKYGSFYTDQNSRPAIFSIQTAAFRAVFFSVPGDEAHWLSLGDNDKYKWEGHTSTLIFFGQLFSRAATKGFDKSNMALIDVGANMGQEVVVASMLGFRSTTFEILPRSVQAIKFNLAANCIPLDMVTIVNAGVSSKNGFLPINVGGFSPSKKSIPSHNDVDTTIHNATLWSMDEYFMGGAHNHHKNTRIQNLSSRALLLKLDCEGCESEALRGSMQLLEKYPPHYIMIEFMPNNALRDTIKEIMTLRRYSRAYVIGYNDEWINQSNVLEYEKRIQSASERKPFNVDTEDRICDLILIHDSAIDLGLFPNQD